jgi:hypothetical protein
MSAEIWGKIKFKKSESKPPFLLGSLVEAIMPVCPIRCKRFFVMKSRDHTTAPIPHMLRDKHKLAPIPRWGGVSATADGVGLLNKHFIVFIERKFSY